MAYYIVVHHQADQHQPWSNVWDDLQRLSAITTTRAIASRLLQAKNRGERIFVHRCAWGTSKAEICCSAVVEAVHDLDKGSAYVRFNKSEPMRESPPMVPHLGQSAYDAPAIGRT